MPELAPYVSDAETWAIRRERYRTLLTYPDTVLLLAWLDHELSGYALGTVMPTDTTWLADTWRTGPLIGQVESLSVLPEFRGHGIGTALLDTLESALTQAGAKDLVIGVPPGNAGAIRLYQRRGYRPMGLYLSRFDGR
jgi:ribosomal protein S18 acetylase RimI-like enzyme